MEEYLEIPYTTESGENVVIRANLKRSKTVNGTVYEAKILGFWVNGSMVNEPPKMELVLDGGNLARTMYPRN